MRGAFADLCPLPPKKSSRVFLPGHQPPALISLAENPQLAFFTGAGLPTFFSIARFSSSARGESSAALALIRKASRPPRWSTLLIALVETRRRTFRPSASEMKVTLHRFGRKRRLVLILEWLTLWPTCGPLAVSSQRRDIAINPLPSPACSVPRGFKISSIFRNRGRIGAGRQGVKVLEGFKAREKLILRAFAGPWPSYKKRIRRRHQEFRRWPQRICPKSAPVRCLPAIFA